MKTLICDCNGTQPLDANGLRRALAQTPGADADGLSPLHHLLCRREAGEFQRAAKTGEPLLVACTQEQRLFLELNGETVGAPPVSERPIRFVNLRETGGWSKDAGQATPKLAALIAAAQLPDAAPVPNVTYRSAGRCLVIGPAALAERAAALLEDKLTVTVFVDGAAAQQPKSVNQGSTQGLAQRHNRTVLAGQISAVTGWLGQFNVSWTVSNPIDLDLCTRCNACIEVCPEGAIDFQYQIDLSRCKSHRDCLKACDAAGAIDFQREPSTLQEAFDLVLDLRAAPAFTQHQPPQGYFHVPGGEAAGSRWSDALVALRELTGEFDKPKFFRYQQRLCAHSRNEQIGCSACIDVCSTQAIRSDASMKGKQRGSVQRGPGGAGVQPASGAGIIVEPSLCVGCGACTTVCPTGALGYAYPGPVDQGRRLRTLLSTYRQAGGRDAALLIHSEAAGAARIEALGRAARTDKRIHGVPARVIPVPVWHTASIGIDLWLMAIAQGASQVWVLLTEEEAPDYRRALAEQMAVAQSILTGLGYKGEHLRLIDASQGHDPSTFNPSASNSSAFDITAFDLALRHAAAQGVAQASTVNAMADKRVTLEAALDHLLKQAPAGAAVPDVIPLPAAGAPLGSLTIDSAACTLCLSCVSACPANALADNAEKPQLRFTEKNCVQCGLCATTCPESAITLVPRLWLADAGRQRQRDRVLMEAQPFHCIRCAKPFGTLRAIENMITKLSGHSAFQGTGVDRLKMCSDCRVVDMFSNPRETRITDL